VSAWISEGVVEDAALAWLEAAGWRVVNGPVIAPGELRAERQELAEAALEVRLRGALARLNPSLPASAIEDAFKRLLRADGPDLVTRNRSTHRHLVNGVTIEYRALDSQIRGTQVRVIDFDHPENNDFLAVNQFTVVEGKVNRRPDVVLFVNGLPLVVFELKNAASEKTDVWEAYRQIQTYKAQIPTLFHTNALLVISDGLEARVGTLTAGKEWFKPWRTVDGTTVVGKGTPELQVVIEGLCEPRRLLDLVRDFIVFEDDGSGALIKKMAGYHQYHAVQHAVRQTLRAAGFEAASPGDGVVRYLPDVMTPAPGERWRDCVPLMPLQAAAGAFGSPQTVLPDDVEWARVDLDRPVREGMFLAQVVGHSMEPQVPHGAWCLFSAPVTGSRNGRTVLVELRDVHDPETGNRYTVKRYESEKVADGDSWRHSRVTLRPNNPDFAPIVLNDVEEGEVAVIAEMIAVLGVQSGSTGDTPAAPGVGKLERGDKRVGVVWHTQGSGKSLTMAFYAGRIIREPAMRNPTLVVLTDRNDLDQQLFGTFSRCQDLLRQPPVQAESRAHLRELLSRESGGVIFTTIQKFYPEERGDAYPALSERRNIVVIADEAHRSQYDFIDGFARHMRDALPQASFIGFTGTPIELTDANTRAVFGEYIDVYDIENAVRDGATVPIYYESRLAALSLDEAERPHIDPDFEEATEDEEAEQREKLKSKWAQLEVVVGSEKRLAMVAADLVEHFETRREALDGKGMVVAMSRRIAVGLYDEIVKLRPAWGSSDDATGVLKVIMTGSASDPVEWQDHIRNKSRRDEMAKRFRDPEDPFALVIVRDMWLTGFDAPSLHTMYVDKPMRGHGLMQAIARVNRVFRDKQGGLVVDYLGLAAELKDALATYTQSGGEGRPTLDQAEAVALMLEKYEICRDLFGPVTISTGVTPGFDIAGWLAARPIAKLTGLAWAQEHILAQENGKQRCVDAVRDLSKAFSLAVPNPAAMEIRDEVGFFQAVSAALSKRPPSDNVPRHDAEHAIRQIISRAVAPEGVIDIFAAAGLEKPNISVLSEEFLAEVREMPQRNLAVEMLEKLLKGELKTRLARNVVQGRSFSEMIERTIIRYRNRSIEAAAVIEELIELARRMREANARGEQLGLTEDELAFYDALEVNDSAVAVLGDAQLREIARELVKTVRSNVTVDWTLRENVRAHLRVLVKRILKRHGYPPDKAEKAVATVLEQAEALSAEWAVG